MSENKELIKSAGDNDEVKALKQKILDLEKERKCGWLYNEIIVQHLVAPYFTIDNHMVLEKMKKLGGWEEQIKLCKENWDYDSDDELWDDIYGEERRNDDFDIDYHVEYSVNHRS
tara:strand:- start:70 stop:414 length:345 start_codon:yes stop_codon:yes gene_type:complete